MIVASFRVPDKSAQSFAIDCMRALGAAVNAEQNQVCMRGASELSVTFFVDRLAAINVEKVFSGMNTLIRQRTEECDGPAV